MSDGYLTALADQAVAFATMTVIPDDQAFRTTSLCISFVRDGRPETLLIEARVIAQTSQMIPCRVEWKRQDGELIAEASAKQLLVVDMDAHWRLLRLSGRKLESTYSG
jgi:acyl-coenzyme A thioesterase PaaI-like protein